MSQMQIALLCNGSFATDCYILTEGEKAWLVDAPAPADRLVSRIRKTGCRLDGIYLTHGHFDHIGAAGELKEIWPEAFIAIHEADVPLMTDDSCRRDMSFFGLHPDFGVISPDVILKDGDVTAFGYKVIHTPGHTPGSVCYYGKEDGIIFTGDTLFQSGIGRTDMPGGSYSQIVTSLKKIVSVTCDEDRVLPGHGPVSEIKAEKQNNPYL